MSKSREEEQLQLFDPDDYRGLNGLQHITIEIDDRDLLDLEQAATMLGMSLSDYINHTLRQLILKEGLL